MKEEYFIGSWVGTPAHPLTNYTFEAHFQVNNEVRLRISGQSFDGWWKIDEQTNQLIFYPPDQPYTIMNRTNDSCDLVNERTNETVYLIKHRS